MHQSQVKMCFLRGPLDWLTEQKNPKFLWSLQNAQRDTTNLAISEDFFRYSKLMFFLCVIYIPLFFLAVLIWLGNSAWDFLGDKFWSSDFLGFCLKPKGFLGVLIFAPVWSSLSLEIRSTPSGLQLSWKGRWIFHTFHPKLISQVEKRCFRFRFCNGYLTETADGIVTNHCGKDVYTSCFSFCGHA